MWGSRQQGLGVEHGDELDLVDTFGCICWNLWRMLHWSTSRNTAQNLKHIAVSACRAAKAHILKAIVEGVSELTPPGLPLRSLSYTLTVCTYGNQYEL